MSGSLLTLGFALEILPGKNRARQEGDWRNIDRCRGQHFLFCKSFYKDVDKYPNESRVPLPSKLDRHSHVEVCGQNIGSVVRRIESIYTIRRTHSYSCWQGILCPKIRTRTGILWRRIPHCS